MIYQQIIISAAKREDIITYFLKSCKTQLLDNKFEFDTGIYVELQKSRPNLIAPFIIHTPVIFTGPKEIIEKMIQEFRKIFLTAGG
jgi:hypothetical protein